MGVSVVGVDQPRDLMPRDLMPRDRCVLTWLVGCVQRSENFALTPAGSGSEAARPRLLFASPPKPR